MQAELTSAGVQLCFVCGGEICRKFVGPFGVSRTRCCPVLERFICFFFFSGLARLAITHSAMNLPVYPPGLTSGERGGATRKEPNK